MGVESTAQVVSAASGWKLPKCERALVLSARLVPDGAGDIGRLHVALTGHWEGHEAGAFDITEAHIDSIVEHFNSRKTPIQVDYNHASVRGLSDEDGKAAGWIRKLSKVVTGKGAELWAEAVEWTEAAAKRIKSGEYKFCSPVILFDRPDPATGKRVPARLFNAALTNVPFLDGLSPVLLSEIAAADEPKPDDEEEPKPDGEGEPVAEAQPEALAEAQAEPADGEAEPSDDGEPETAEEAESSSEPAAAVKLIDNLARLTGVDTATVVDLIGRKVDAFVSAINAALDYEQRQRATEKQQAVSMSEPTSEVDKKIKAIEEQTEKARMLALSENLEAAMKRIQDLEDGERKRTAAALEARVDADIAAGRVRDDQRADALLVLSERGAEMYGRLFVQQVVPTKMQAGADPVIDPKSVELSALDDATRMGVEMTMGLTNFKTGKQFTAREAIERTVENMKAARKAG